MKIYHVHTSSKIDYDEYDGFVVIAETMEKAREMVREKTQYHSYDVFPFPHHWKEIGTANDDAQEGILLESFNAG